MGNPRVRGAGRARGEALRPSSPRDPGPGFDPRLIPSPVRGQNLFRHHGRGIYLINQLMDEVSFERGGTEIRMLKR